MNKRKQKGIVIVIVLAVAGLLIMNMAKRNGSADVVREVRPFRGNIQNTISTTGTVEPQNRLEIKPPIAGRIEKILVREGQAVKVGDILALMSSTERAALLDAATLKGETEIEYWRDVYKETPLIAPIDGEVIVRAVEPGQTVTTSDAVLVLSDRLIVQADVDETDIGEIKTGQKAMITLDAYPDIQVNATVDHISYESTLVNNVTIYEVDILPEDIPAVFRSGMSANVEVVVSEKTGALLVPVAAVKDQGGKSSVLLKAGAFGEATSREVEVGLRDEENIEVLSGIDDKDVLLVADQSYSSAKKETGSNPFMPFRNRKKK